jgi:hypothetical protein
MSFPSPFLSSSFANSHHFQMDLATVCYEVARAVGDCAPGRQAATTARPCGQHGEGATAASDCHHPWGTGTLTAGKSMAEGGEGWSAPGDLGTPQFAGARLRASGKSDTGMPSPTDGSRRGSLESSPSTRQAESGRRWRAWTVGMSRGSLGGSRPVAGGSRGLGPSDPSGEWSGQSECLRRVEARPVHGEVYEGRAPRDRGSAEAMRSRDPT